MHLYVSEQQLAELETALAQAGAADRIATQLVLAWQLRQRDGARALLLADALQAPLPSPALRARDALMRCEIAALQSQLDSAESWLAEARAQLPAAGDAALEGDALLAEAQVAKARSQRERELDAYARAAAFFAGSGDARRTAIAQSWLAYERAFAEPDGLSLPPADADDPAVAALWSAAQGLSLSRREPARAAELLLRASAQAESCGLQRHAVICRLNAGAALQGLGDFEQAADCYDQATTAARARGWPALIGSCQTRLGAFLQELGQLDEARAMLSDALDWLALTPVGINKANACSALAHTLLALGRGIEAVGPMAEAIRMYREARSTDNLAVNLLGYARALSASGQADAALNALDEAQALMARHGFSALQVGVYEALAEIHQRHPQLPPPAGMRSPNAALHYGEATLAEGLRIANWKAPASLHVQLAEAWAQAGDLARAWGHARQAFAAKDQETAFKLSHPLALLRLRQLGSELPGAARPAAAAEPTQSARLLTPKELEVLQLLARNYSNKEIASTLECSDETVKWHLKKIYAKLEAGSRKHAVTRARSLGVISFSA